MGLLPEYTSTVYEGNTSTQVQCMRAIRVHKYSDAPKTTLPVCTQNRRLHFVCIHMLCASPFHKHPSATPSEPFVLRLQHEEARCDFGLIFLLFLSYKYECVVGTKHASLRCTLYLLYSFWMSTLVSTTAAGDETCRSKKQIPTKSCKLWLDWLRCCIAQLDCPVSAASCGCVHSVALTFTFLSFRYIFLTLTLRETFLTVRPVGGPCSCVLCLILVLILQY